MFSDIVHMQNLNLMPISSVAACGAGVCVSQCAHVPEWVRVVVCQRACMFSLAWVGLKHKTSSSHTCMRVWISLLAHYVIQMTSTEILPLREPPTPTGLVWRSRTVATPSAMSRGQSAVRYVSAFYLTLCCNLELSRLNTVNADNRRPDNVSASSEAAVRHCWRGWYFGFKKPYQIITVRYDFPQSTVTTITSSCALILMIVETGRGGWLTVR